LLYKEQKYTGQQIVANIFNQFFCNVAEELCNALPSRDFKFDRPSLVNSLCLENTTEKEIEDTILGMKIKCQLEDWINSQLYR
jgi:hypothetical protein